MSGAMPSAPEPERPRSRNGLRTDPGHGWEAHGISPNGRTWVQSLDLPRRRATRHLPLPAELRSGPVCARSVSQREPRRHRSGAERRASGRPGSALRLSRIAAAGRAPASPSKPATSGFVGPGKPETRVKAVDYENEDGI
jgi:hypothetical protein